jgi:hypothetical protein
MLLLAAKNPWHVPLYAIDFAWLEAPDDLANPNFPDIVNSHLYSEEEVMEKLKTVQDRVRGLTKGLLEVVEDVRHHNVVNVPPCPSFHGKAVQFFHRTARDYIIENPERLKALLESFPRFDELYPYARLWFAEYSRVFRHTCSNGPEGNPLELQFKYEAEFPISRLRKIYPEHLGEIGKGCYLAIRQRLQCRRDTGKPYDVPQGMIYNGMGYSTPLLPHPASTVHYLALQGFTEFVLSEIKKDLQLKRTAGGLSLLISAIKGERWELASEILQGGVELDDMFSVVHDSPGPKSEYPLWFVAAVAIIEKFLWQISRDRKWPSVNLLQLLVQHGTSNGETFTISFSSKDSERYDNGYPHKSFEYWQHLNASRSLRPSQVNDLPITDLASFFGKVMSCDEAQGAELSATPFFGSITFGAFLNLLLGGDRAYEGTISHSSCSSLPFVTSGTLMGTRVC